MKIGSIKCVFCGNDGATKDKPELYPMHDWCALRIVVGAFSI